MHIRVVLLLISSLSLVGAIVACSSSDGSSDVGADDDNDITKLPTCGGAADIQCAIGSDCVDDPRDTCDPSKGGRNCPGVCKRASNKCSVFAPCPTGYSCVNTDRECTGGGFDCGGVCRKR
jgi:hypothetical protein